ncbi:LCP family protein [Actinokineospora spheciospongiae]|uniref:LCP family protein n=1 Tax=Actinokineospora spheciospongiae TaxID=909613 RepID=UPI0006902CE1|nr:LCP family protein [Actinokineospora spheciospongiae]
MRDGVPRAADGEEQGVEYRPPGSGSAAGRERSAQARADRGRGAEPGAARSGRPADRVRQSADRTRQPGDRGRQPGEPADRRQPPPDRRGRAAEPAREPRERRGAAARGRTPERAARPTAARANAAAPTEKIAPRARPAAAPVADRRPRYVAGKSLVTLLSAAMVVTLGYYWKVTDDFSDDLTRANVIDGASVEKPADGAIDILMVGMDSRTDPQGNPLSKERLAELHAGVADGEVNTDTLILIRIPNDGGKATGISIPRDSYVDIPGHGKHKINSAYGRAKLQAYAGLKEDGVGGRDLEVRSNLEGAKSVIATVNKLTGATVDHYAEINLFGFADITQAIGGVEVCLNKATKDKFSGADFPAGVQTISGVPALAFVRQRHGLPNGDLDRIVRQQTFMGAMAKKVFSQDVIAPGSETLPKLQEAISKSVVLDEDWNIMQFAQQMTGITGGKVAFETIPHGTIDLQTPNDGSAIEIDPDDVRAFVRHLLTPDAPTSSAGPSSAPAGGTTEPGSTEAESKPTVNVLNGSGRTGLAADVVKTLTGKGFTEGSTGNAAARAKTVIRYATGQQDLGTMVADALGGDYTVEQDSDLGKGKVSVILGKDYTTADGFGGAPALDLGAPARAALQPAVPCIN